MTGQSAFQLFIVRRVSGLHRLTFEHIGLSKQFISAISLFSRDLKWPKFGQANGCTDGHADGQSTST